MPGALAFLFLLSGAAALVFEALWFRQAGLALGNDVWASSIVLSSFMAGIALGNGFAARLGGRLARPLLAYGLAEAIVALTGVAITHRLPHLGALLAPLLGGFTDNPALLNAARLTVAFLSLMGPALAMGLTLPLLTRALATRGGGFGVSLGLLYGFNTAGAAIGAFAAEAWLIGAFGIRGSAWIAGALAISAGAIAVGCDRLLVTPPKPTDRQARPQAAARPDLRLLLAAFLCGFALLGLEVLWVRFLSLFVPSSGLIFASMLSVVLIGIALGSLFATGWLSLRSTAPAWLAPLACAAGVLTLAGYALFDPEAELRRWLVVGLGFDRHLGLAALLALRLSFPVALCSGAIFTLQGAALHERLGGDAARSAGLLTLANTLGAVVGSFATGIFALPAWGLERCLLAAAALYAIAALAMLRRPLWRSVPSVAGIVGLAACAAAFALFPRGALTERFLPLALGSQFEQQGESLVALREARDGTLRLLRTDFLGEALSYRLLTNGMSMTGNDWHSRRYMEMFVTLPVALLPAPKQALLIGYGIGSTARALTREEGLERIVVVDPSAQTLELASMVFASSGHDPLRDPRVEVRLEDGRFFLQTTQERFDLISGEPPPPKAPGVVSLYTREQFQAIRDRLNSGGIVSYWLPLASLTKRDGDAILAAFLAVFPNMTLWYGWNHDLIMLGSNGPTAAVSAAHFARQWSEQPSADALRALGLEGPEQLVASFVADAAFLSKELAGVAPLTDDAPHRLSPRIVEIEAGQAALASWLDEARSLAIFEDSDWVARQLPSELRDGAREWFLDQQLQRWSAAAGRGLPSAEELQEVIGVSTLQEPVSWLLHSDADRQRIAARHREAPGAAHHLAADALARRRFADAATEFARAEREHSPRARLYGAYALCLDGRHQAFERLLPPPELRRAPGVGDWEWLMRNCQAIGRR